MINKKFCYFLFATCTLLFSSCYSFQGTSIPAEVESYYVERFDVRAASAIPTIGQTFSEALKDRIRAESNLKPNDTDPHIEFRGVVTDYRVTAEAPQAGETTAFNRLTIVVSVEYIYHLDEEENWEERFSFFADFPSNTNLIDVQSSLIEDDIVPQLTDKVFNKAFTNW